MNGCINQQSTIPRTEPSTIPQTVQSSPVQSSFSLPSAAIREQVNYNQAYYYQGQKLEIEYLFTNEGQDTLKFESFPPELIISPANATVDIPIRVFSGGKERKDLEPRDTAKFTIIWDQLDKDGKPVPIGVYRTVIHDYKITNRPLSISHAQDIGMLWVGQEGIMRDYTTEVGESKIKDGVTFTLESVKFNPFGNVIRVFCSPPNYKSKANTSVFAFYKLDGRIVQGAGYPDIEWLDKGIRFTWSKLEPVSKKSSDYSFTITGFNHNSKNWIGNWDFQIPLK
jgi:hypothetical protein